MAIDKAIDSIKLDGPVDVIYYSTLLTGPFGLGRVGSNPVILMLLVTSTLGLLFHVA